MLAFGLALINFIVMSNETKSLLQDFYHPYNEQLYDLLGRDEWQDVWEQPVNTTTTRQQVLSASKQYV